MVQTPAALPLRFFFRYDAPYADAFFTMSPLLLFRDIFRSFACFRFHAIYATRFIICHCLRSLPLLLADAAMLIAPRALIISPSPLYFVKMPDASATRAYDAAFMRDDRRAMPLIYDAAMMPFDAGRRHGYVMPATATTTPPEKRA